VWKTSATINTIRNALVVLEPPALEPRIADIPPLGAISRKFTFCCYDISGFTFVKLL
jgi:hypothetical protein